MSSILEALERAELERNARETVPPRQPLSRPKNLWQRPGVWLVGGGLLLLNLLVWWLMLDSEDTHQVARIPQAQTTLAPHTTAQIAPSTQLRESPLMTEARVPPKVSPTPIAQPVATDKLVSAAPAKATRTTVPPLLEAVILPAATTPVPAVAPAQPTARQPDVALPTATVMVSSKEATPEVETLDSVEQLPASSPAAEQRPRAEALKSSTPVQIEEPEVSTPEPVIAEAVPEVADEAVVEKVERIPEIWELPAAAQQKLKGLKINIHVYNEIPAERFVIIGMRRYREGDALARAGLKLVSITREGVIIDYGEGKVKM